MRISDWSSDVCSSELDGSQVVDYDPGIYYGGSASAIGGDGLDWREVSNAVTGVERYTGTANGHFDITSNVKVIGEFLYGHQKGTDPYGTQAILRTLFNRYDGGAGLVLIDRTNTYMTQGEINSTDAGRHGYAAGEQHKRTE